VLYRDSLGWLVGILRLANATVNNSEISRLAENSVGFWPDALSRFRAYGRSEVGELPTVELGLGLGLGVVGR
jgi:hypothetical protein